MGHWTLRRPNLQNETVNSYSTNGADKKTRLESRLEPVTLRSTQAEVDTLTNRATKSLQIFVEGQNYF